MLIGSVIPTVNRVHIFVICVWNATTTLLPQSSCHLRRFSFVKNLLRGSLSDWIDNSQTFVLDSLFLFNECQSLTMLVLCVQEFMLATNMSDATSSEEKLRWAFKMYDQDSSGLDDFC
jgi:hypothetical protein